MLLNSILIFSQRKEDSRQKLLLFRLPMVVGKIIIPLQSESRLRFDLRSKSSKLHSTKAKLKKLREKKGLKRAKARPEKALVEKEVENVDTYHFYIIIT